MKLCARQSDALRLAETLNTYEQTHDGLLASLPEVLDYTGEFGSELVLFVPFCNWLSREGLLRNRRIRTYRGMRCFYDDLDCLEILEKDEPRTWIPPKDRPPWLPVKDEHTFDGLGRASRHIYPDLRSKFRRLPMLPGLDVANRPLLIIHNKYNVEWGLGPVNYIPLTALENAFRLLKSRFTIVYVRHGTAPSGPGFSGDHNALLPFEDRELLDRHPEVSSFDDLFAAHRSQGGTQDLNTFKNVLYSRCYNFITSQGGGAHHIALYSGSTVAILHRRGSEELWAYRKGYYRFMAPIPPNLAICHTESELISALSLFTNPMLEERVIPGCRSKA